MAASSNESFGLKIATSLSIALTVMLLVAVYFLNSYYTQEVQKTADLEKKLAAQATVLKDRDTEATEYRTRIGLQAIDDFEQAKTQMKKDSEAIKTELQTMQSDIATVVSDFQKKMEGKGVDAAQFEALKQKSRELVDAYITNSSTSYIDSVRRLKDLTINQARLSTNIALSYIDLRRELELANKVNADMKKVVEDAYATAKAELDATIKKDEDARSGIVTELQAKSDQLNALDTKLTNVTNDLQAKIDDRDKRVANLKANNRDLTDRLSLNENVMTKSGGRVTFVDYATKTIRVSVTARKGSAP